MLNSLPGPVVGAGLPAWSLLVVAFSAGGDGGGRSSEHPAQRTFICGSQQRRARPRWRRSP